MFVSVLHEWMNEWKNEFFIFKYWEKKKNFRQYVFDFLIGNEKNCRNFVEFFTNLPKKLDNNFHKTASNISLEKLRKSFVY